MASATIVAIIHTHTHTHAHRHTRTQTHTHTHTHTHNNGLQPPVQSSEGVKWPLFATVFFPFPFPRPVPWQYTPPWYLHWPLAFLSWFVGPIRRRRKMGKKNAVRQKGRARILVSHHHSNSCQ
jgi:hypothetical protein